MTLAAGTPGTMAVAVPALSTGGAGLHLQVGAFGARQNAEEMRQRLLRLLEDPVYVAEPGVDSVGVRSDLYRVRIGPVASRSVADTIAQQLSAAGYSRPVVVDF
jgi:rare lipoprotein A